MTQTIFFGYPESPRSVADSIQSTARALKSATGAETVTWQDLRVDGTIVIDTVLRAIDRCDLAVFDVTVLNPNVLYEIGYAIARAKPVWLTLDSTNASAKRRWNELAILRDVGYTPYKNSGDLVAQFVRKDPLNALEPIYDTLIEPALPDSPEARRALLYCTTFEPFEASSRLSILIEQRQQRGLEVVVSDPSESSLNPLTWFAPLISRSAGVLINFAGESRNRAELFNNRHALVAGLATGLEVPVLMLAENDYPAPFDYQARLIAYETAAECVEPARAWVDQLQFEGISWSAPRVHLATKLAGLRFGEHVAENERTELDDYFVETAAYGDVIAARDTIFIGHRGTGKTASASQAFQHLSGNKTNLALLIKPPSFEFAAMLAVVKDLPEHQRDYFFDSLWTFVIQTEIAAAVYSKLTSRNVAVPFNPEERAFLDYALDAPFDIKADVSVRLEQTLRNLASSLSDDVAEPERQLINEAFHTSALVQLRAQLGHVLKGRRRVAVFIDNLDKGWERGADFKAMARFILGLLTARGRVVIEFEKEDYWRDSIKLTVAVFLRSDIYNYLRTEAREPDKLPVSTIQWRDPQTLLAVIERRFLTSESRNASVEELWKDYFCASVVGEPTKDFLIRVTLPRPRDIVYLCNSAVARAIDRMHDKVEEEDFLAAQEVYSQYAYEALLVENGVTIPEMEESLLSFIDAPAELATSAIFSRLRDGGINEGRIIPIFNKLIAMSFFGPEISAGEFTFPEVGSDTKIALTRAARLHPDEDTRTYRIHSAFHRFLGIS